MVERVQHPECRERQLPAVAFGYAAQCGNLTARKFYRQGVYLSYLDQQGDEQAWIESLPKPAPEPEQMKGWIATKFAAPYYQPIAFSPAESKYQGGFYLAFYTGDGATRRAWLVTVLPGSDEDEGGLLLFVSVPPSRSMEPCPLWAVSQPDVLRVIARLEIGSGEAQGAAPGEPKDKWFKVTPEQCVTAKLPPCEIKLSAPGMSGRADPVEPKDNGRGIYLSCSTPPGDPGYLRLVHVPNSEDPYQTLIDVATESGRRPLGVSEFSPRTSVFLAGEVRPAIVARWGRQRACGAHLLVLLKNDTAIAVAHFKGRAREEGPFPRVGVLLKYWRVFETLTFEAGQVSPEFTRQLIEQTLARKEPSASDEAAAPPPASGEAAAPPPASEKRPESAILAKVKAYLIKDNWPLSEPKSVGTRSSYIISRFKGKNALFKCMAVANRANQLLFYSLYPGTIPPAMRTAVAEVLHLANYGLHIGNFEIDLGDGEVRFKTSLDLDGIDLNDAVLAQLIGCNCRMVDRYYPAVRAVVADGMAPKEAIAIVEGA